MEAVISTTDLAEELGVTPETVVRWIRDGWIEGAFQRRGRWRIPLEEAEAFAEKYERRGEVEEDEEWEEEDYDPDASDEYFEEEDAD